MQETKIKNMFCFRIYLGILFSPVNKDFASRIISGKSDFFKVFYRLSLEGHFPQSPLGTFLPTALKVL